MRSLITVLLVITCATMQAAEKRSIKVTAKSEIKVAPDEVFLDLRVRTRDKELLKAKRENDKIASTIMAFTPTYLISSEDVKVTGLTVSPYFSGLFCELRRGKQGSSAVVGHFHNGSVDRTR